VLAFPQYSGHIRFFDWILATPLFLVVFRVFGNAQLVRQENLLTAAGVAVSVLAVAYRYLPFVDPSLKDSTLRSTIGGVVVALLAYILYEVAFLVRELEGATNFDTLFFLLAVWISGGLYYIYTEQEPTSQVLYLLIKVAFALACG
jgi:bacteriorhodopsin